MEYYKISQEEKDTLVLFLKSVQGSTSIVIGMKGIASVLESLPKIEDPKEIKQDEHIQENKESI